VFERVKDFVVEYLSGLDERERFVIFLGVPVFIFLLYVILVYFPIKSMTDTFIEKEEKLREKVEKIKPSLEELTILRKELDPVLRKIDNGNAINLTTYVKSQVEKSGVNLKNLKVSTGKGIEGIEVRTVSVDFGETPLNKVSSLIYNLERNSYYFRCTGIEISDMDENGLVSGKVTFNFYRRAE
jgi:general secretion pathway protein M